MGVRARAGVARCARSRLVRRRLYDPPGLVLHACGYTSSYYTTLHTYGTGRSRFSVDQV